MAALPDLPQTEIAIVEMTNAFRKENKLGEVKPNPALTAAARAFAEYLAKTDKFAHEADGRRPHQRAEAKGYRYCFVAENLALNLDSRGFETRKLAGDVMKGWENSPGHRANLLQPKVTEVGVAVVRAPDKNPKYISVQLLGQPDAFKAEFKIENRAGAPVSYTLGKETHTLPARGIVTYTSCDPGQLTFGRAGQPYDPRNGDLFVVRSERDRVWIDVERKP
jgi:hypothetical protein